MQFGDDTPGRDPLRVSGGGVVVAQGFGTSVLVEAGQLVVRTGSGRTVRTGRFERPGRRKLVRLVLVGRTGVVTLPGLDWVRQVGAAWSWIGRDGEVLATSATLGLDDGRLRRAQAMAPFTDAGVRVVGYLLHEKVSGQLSILRRYFPERASAADSVEVALHALENAETIERMRLLESRAAAAYWSGWRGLSLTFARRDLARVPPRWAEFESRASLVTGNPRLSTDPVGSMLNLGYALLECEARVSLAICGLDASMAFGLHSDVRARANGAVDLMESGRGAADKLVLDAIGSRVYRRSDFHELPNGVCRIAPALARTLIEAWVPSLSTAVAPHAENVAAMLAKDAGAERLPTRLSGRNRSMGRNAYRKGPQRERTAGHLRERTLPAACRSCGVVLEGSNRLYCNECRSPAEAQHLDTFSRSGPVALAQLRAEGRDPLRSPEAKRKVGASQSARYEADKAWEKAHAGERPDPEGFRAILPGLAGVPLRKIAAATGLSLAHCGQVRRGLKTPHPRHWDALRAIAASLGDVQS